MSGSQSSRRFLDLETHGFPAIIAHRGNSSHAPENTLEAAVLGFEVGADAWELDVRQTRDGVPVILHDASLRRTTDVAKKFPGDPRAKMGYRVADFDLEEVRILDAGGWFLDPEGGPRSALYFGTLARIDPGLQDRIQSGLVRVPTLVEALELTRARNWFVNVELKSEFGGDFALVSAILAAIRETETTDHVLVSSFDHEDLAELIRRAPDLDTGVLTTAPLYQAANYVNGLGAKAYHISAEALGENRGSLLPTSSLRRDAAFVALRSAKVPVLVYTVNDANDGGMADRLVVAGASGIFTDDPAALVQHWRPGRLAPPPWNFEAETVLAAVIEGAATRGQSSRKAHQTPQG